MCLLLHPDKEKTGNTSMFQERNTAHKVLKDPAAKFNYDIYGADFVITDNIPEETQQKILRKQIETQAKFKANRPQATNPW